MVHNVDRWTTRNTEGELVTKMLMDTSCPRLTMTPGEDDASYRGTQIGGELRDTLDISDGHTRRKDDDILRRSTVCVEIDIPADMNCTVVELNDVTILRRRLPQRQDSAEHHGVRRTPVYRWKPGVWLATPSPALLELVGAPESARLLDRAPLYYWVEEMGKERAMVAAATLQRDAGVMLSNLQILSQFAMALNRMSFSMMALGLDRSVFPGAEVEALSPAPRARRAAPYMSAMGLWRPQENPTAPRPAPTPSCNLCRNCKYCFPDNQLPPE